MKKIILAAAILIMSVTVASAKTVMLSCVVSVTMAGNTSLMPVLISYEENKTGKFRLRVNSTIIDDGRVDGLGTIRIFGRVYKFTATGANAYGIMPMMGFFMGSTYVHTVVVNYKDKKPHDIIVRHMLFKQNLVGPCK